MVSIIIPIYNEEKILRAKREYYLSLKSKAEVFFVDGGSIDGSVNVAAEYGRVLSSPKGRAIQKNTGAFLSAGDLLLFLHVDACLSNEAIDVLSILKAQAGCFTMVIDDHRLIFRLYEKIVNWRAKRKKLIDGDLGLFVRSDIFTQLNGFKKLSIMDDIEFSERLRNICVLNVLPESIHVSSRRWDEKGFISTLWRYTLAYVQHHTGIQIFK